ncbi:helix-turn-helix domain-containing protein [Microbacterium panaciterrae]|uniref:Helix-turn-helix domain-containing protein n=1 Tax=Microbacterium panaciterrae TaxID=985759 RepID=A0ABP8P6K5_9MICO
MHTIDNATIATADIDDIVNALEALPHNTATDEIRSFAEKLRNTTITLIEDDEELTPNQAAQFLRMSRPMVVALIEKGELLAKIVGKRDRRIPMSELRDFQARRNRASKQFAEALAQSSDDTRRDSVLRRAGVSSEDAAELGF